MAAGTIRFLGHSFFEFTTADGHVVLLDPWTADDGNPACPVNKADITKADLILASHDHADHIGSMVALAEQTGAMIGGIVQTMGRLINEGFDADKVVNFGSGYHFGGGVSLDWINVTAVPAWHSSDTATASGIILRVADGTCIYHAGDTGIFGDMALFGQLYPLDLALLPIGGVFTMDALQATLAVGLLQPKRVIPMHYGSFPILAKTADDFVRLCGETAPEIKVDPIKPGESLVLD